MVFISPSGNASIEIWQTRFENSWGGRGELVSGERRTEIFRISEAFLYFVHVYWSPDEKTVAVFATAIPMRMAFDVPTGRPIPFERVRAALSTSIQKAYALPGEADPLEWASTPQATEAFFARHPEIDVSYHRP
jgi:hypothetical protein